MRLDRFHVRLTEGKHPILILSGRINEQKQIKARAEKEVSEQAKSHEMLPHPPFPQGLRRMIRVTKLKIFK